MATRSSSSSIRPTGGKELPGTVLAGAVPAPLARRTPLVRTDAGIAPRTPPPQDLPGSVRPTAAPGRGPQEARALRVLGPGGMGVGKGAAGPGAGQGRLQDHLSAGSSVLGTPFCTGPFLGPCVSFSVPGREERATFLLPAKPQASPLPATSGAESAGSSGRGPWDSGVLGGCCQEESLPSYPLQACQAAPSPEGLQLWGTCWVLGPSLENKGWGPAHRPLSLSPPTVLQQELCLLPLPASPAGPSVQPFVFTHPSTGVQGAVPASPSLPHWPLPTPSHHGP